MIKICLKPGEPVRFHTCLKLLLKLDTGFSLYLMPVLRHTFLPAAHLFEDNSNLVPTDSSTGNWWLHSRPRSDSEDSRMSSVNNAMPSPPSPTPPTTTYGRRRPGLSELNSNSGLNLCNEATIWIGPPSKMQLSREGWTMFRQTCLCEITTSSSALVKIICDRLLLSESLLCTGVQLGLASQDELGTKQVSRHILKILGLSSGMDIEIKNMLLSMNSVGTSISLMSCDGSTGIQLLWKSRVPPLS